MNINTPQRQTLLRAKACNEPIATILGLSFANRDLDLIEHLKTLHPLPVFAELPSAEVCQRAWVSSSDG